MLGQAAGLEHVLELLLAPAAARLGRVAQRIDQLGGFGRDALGAGAHRLDLARQQPERVAPLGLDLLHRRLVALKPLVDRLEQRLQVLAGSFFRLAEALVGALEEGFLRLGQQFAADLRELRRQRFLGLDQLLDPRLEPLLALQLRRFERREPGRGIAVGIPFPDHLVELGAERLDGLLRAGGFAAREQPADECAESERNQSDYDSHGIHESASLRNR